MSCQGPGKRGRSSEQGGLCPPRATPAHSAAFPPDTILPAQESFLQPDYLCLSLTQARRSPKHSPVLLKIHV